MPGTELLPLSDAIAAEASLYQHLTRGELGYAVWRTTQGLVATRSEARLAHFDDAADESAARGWPVVLRGSGGGTVPQGPGLLNVTRVRRLSAAADLTVEEEYLAFGSILRDAFRSVTVETRYGDVPRSYCDGRYNLVADERKLVGTAQRWSFRDGDRIAMAHALVNVSLDLAEACEAVNDFYERAGSDQRVCPDAHVTLSELSSRPISDLTAALVAALESSGHKPLPLGEP